MNSLMAVAGGVAYPNKELAQLFYPSHRYLGPKGIVIGYDRF
jgi:hypothetical protein